MLGKVLLLLGFFAALLAAGTGDYNVAVGARTTTAEIVTTYLAFILLGTGGLLIWRDSRRG
jgi:hypothetical protein